MLPNCPTDLVAPQAPRYGKACARVAVMVAISKSKNPSASSELVVSRTVDAPISVVFHAWATPEHVVQWWGPRGFVVPSWQMDFVRGGAFRGSMRSPDGKDHWHHGIYREIEGPVRLVFTLAWENEPKPETLVTVTFAAEGEKTKVVLHQAGLESEESANDHASGWSECLERLAEYAPTLRG
jgi:uncharacterized protein YndB with AHSA1/START domain